MLLSRPTTTMVLSPTPQIVRFGVFSFDRVTGDLWKKGRRIKLQDQPRQVLAMLVERPGDLITREELCSALWHDDTFVDFDTGLNVVINKIRQALDDSASSPRFIETLPRRGYRFLAPVVAEREPVPHTTGLVGVPRASVLWITGVALVALLVLGGYAFTTGRSRAAASPPTAFDGLKPQRLTGDGNAGRAVALSRDGSWVAYTVVEPNGESLRVRQVSANASVQVVPLARGRFGGMTFSPDDSFVYYTFFAFESPVSQLYRVPVLGGPPQKLAGEHIDTVVAFSPDGQRIAFGRADSGTTMIYVSAVDGGQPRLLAERKNPDGFFFQTSGNTRLAWSPDGKFIAVPIVEHAPDTAIGIVKTTTGEVTTLGNARWYGLYALQWLPDGRGLLAAGNDKNGQSLSSQVWQVDHPSGWRRQVTNDLSDYLDISLSADARTFAASDAESFSTLWVAAGPSLAQMSEITTEGKHEEGVEGLCWTPDDRLIYSSTASGNLDLWELDLQRGSKRQLTTDPTSDYHPAVSPDGRTVAFVSHRGGQRQIWVMDRDGTKARALSMGPFDVLPFWGADGSFILFDRIIGGDRVALTVSFPGGQEKPFAGFAGTTEVPARAFRPRAFSRQGLLGGYSRSARSIVIVSPTGTLLRKIETLGAVPGTFTWTPDGLALTAVNRRDNFNIWSYPVDGSEPRRLTGFAGAMTFTTAWSPDGKRLALSRGQDSLDVVVFKTPDK